MSDDDRAHLRRMIDASWTTQAIATACAHGLPDLMARGALDSGALAAASGCHAASMHRLLRALSSLGLCIECGDARFELTSRGALLCEESPASLRAWAMLCGTLAWAPWGELEESVRSGRSYRERHAGSADFSHLDRNPRAAALFHRAMVDLTRHVAQALVEAVRFDGVHEVVDVGGGHGALIAAVLGAHPGMQGVLYDLEHAVSGAQELLGAAGVADRCERRSGDFFDAVPGGADAYLLKSVLHDWDDARCMRILGNCRQAMNTRARLLIIERIAPVRYEATHRDQSIARSDLNMLVALSGRERTEAEFGALLDASGLRLAQVVGMASEYSVIEARAR